MNRIDIEPKKKEDMPFGGIYIGQSKNSDDETVTHSNRFQTGFTSSSNYEFS